MRDYLFLRGNSNISTTAGFDHQSRGNGGNITINTPAIAAIPKQKNNLTANSFTGRGGNVDTTKTSTNPEINCILAGFSLKVVSSRKHFLIW